MVKTGEADIGFLMAGPEAIETERDPKLRLLSTFSARLWFLVFPEQWDAKSRWSDRRVLLAATIGVTPLTYFPTPHEDMSLKESALHVPSPP